MANINAKKGVIGILTGGGDVPGLNPAIRAVTFRALREGYEVVGIRRGWGGLVDIVRDAKYDNSNNFQRLTEDIVNRAGRTGGTFLHTSRTRPSNIRKSEVPDHLKSSYPADKNDLTPHVLRHTNAMLLQAQRVDIATIALWLGHESIKTTYIYQHADNKLKQEAIDRTATIGTPPGRYQPPDSLIAFLEAL